MQMNLEMLDCQWIKNQFELHYSMPFWIQVLLGKKVVEKAER